MHSRPGSFGTLVRCAATSLLAVSFEFVLLTMMVNWLHMHYLVAFVLSTVVYLFLNYVLNRVWAFRAGHRPVTGQLARHAGVVAVGMGLGIGLLRFFVGSVGLPYQFGWAVTALIGFFGWTYPMSRLFTFV